MTYLVFIGIDPGKTGGVAVRTGKKMEVFPIDRLPDVLYANRGCSPLCTVERQHNMPLQGAKQRSSIARQAGFIEGLCLAHEIPMEEVRAVDWQKLMLKSEPRKTREQRKESSIKIARRLFPKIDLTMGTGKKMKDGAADAILIAEYAKRTRS